MRFLFSQNAVVCQKRPLIPHYFPRFTQNKNTISGKMIPVEPFIATHMPILALLKFDPRCLVITLARKPFRTPKYAN
jgi:hypothetical protein